MRDGRAAPQARHMIRHRMAPSAHHDGVVAAPPAGGRNRAAAAPRDQVAAGGSMYLDLLEPVKLGESVQWVRVRSAAPGNPLLLLIQQGPSLPMINEIGEFGRLLRLEAHFTVPYGTGRSPLLGRRSDGSRLGSEA